MEQICLQIQEDYALTEIRNDDAKSLAYHINDPSIHENTLQIPYPYSINDGLIFIQLCKEFVEKNSKVNNYAIRYKNQMIGGIGLLYNHGIHAHRSEIGYWISREHRRKGIMTKTIRAFSKFCFETKGLLRLEALIFEENKASMKAIENAGFSLEGKLMQAYIKNGKIKNAFLYAFLKNPRQ